MSIYIRAYSGRTRTLDCNKVLNPLRLSTATVTRQNWPNSKSAHLVNPGHGNCSACYFNELKSRQAI